MFYCPPCGKKKGWPETLSRSQGRCEVCDRSAICYDTTPSKHLPEAKTGSRSGGLEEFADVLPVVSDGSYQPDDRIRLDATVRQVWSRSMTVTLNGFPGTVVLSRKVVATLLERKKTPGQVLYEELIAKDTSAEYLRWQNADLATKDRYERAAGKVRDMKDPV